MIELDLKDPVGVFLIEKLALLLRANSNQLPFEYYKEMARRIFLERDSVSFLIVEYDGRIMHLFSDEENENALH